MPDTESADFPAADNFTKYAGIGQIFFAWAKGKLVDGVRGDIVANVEYAGPLLTGPRF